MPMKKKPQGLLEFLIPPLPDRKADGRIHVSGRFVFWVVFLTAAATYGTHIWRTRDPLRKNPLFIPYWTQRNLDRLADTDPEAAAKAWHELYGLYNTKWQAYHIMLPRVSDDRPVHFSLRLDSSFGRRTGACMSLWPAPGKAQGPPERVLNRYGKDCACRTAGEALMAIVYDEGTWVVDYAGDWQAWWKANKHLFQPPPQVEKP